MKYIKNHADEYEQSFKDLQESLQQDDESQFREIELKPHEGTYQSSFSRFRELMDKIAEIERISGIIELKKQLPDLIEKYYKKD